MENTGVVTLTKTEKKWIKDRMEIELEWGEEVYSKKELNLMNRIIKKLSE